MSRMELYYGVFEPSDLNLVPEDTDEFYDIEESHGCHYVVVEGQLYSFKPLAEIDEFGFMTVLEPVKSGTAFIAYWYNGGAGIHEVVESLIKNRIGA